jgi:hypothetical protein
MSEKYYRGKITYINNDKQIATIEYITGNKSKNIQAIIDDKQQEKYVQLKLIKKPHRFLVGDNVKFIIKRSSAGVFFADHVLYEFNNALEVLINKARSQLDMSSHNCFRDGSTHAFQIAVLHGQPEVLCFLNKVVLE